MLLQDKTAGALDAANGMEYVRMLRRAMDLGGFHQVIFICHTPLVSKLADRILPVCNGSVFIWRNKTWTSGGDGHPTRILKCCVDL